MPLLKKVAKVVAKGAKKGVKLAGKVAKQSPPYGAGRVAGSLVRGKAPRMSDVMTTVGAPPIKKKRDVVSKLKKVLIRRKVAVGKAWSMPPKTAASSTSRPPTPRRKPSARAQARAEALGRNSRRKA